MKFMNIMVPFDKSEHALHALEIAKGMAEEDPAIRLHVVSIIHVTDIPPSVGYDGNPYDSLPAPLLDPDLYEKLVVDAREREKDSMLETMGSILHELSNDVTIAVINDPSIVEGIIGYAHDNACDLIVMGSRGLGILRGMLGSTSHGVLRAAEIPVMIAKEPESKEKKDGRKK